MSDYMDPRVIRTQELLKSALYRLLQSGISLHQISVQKLMKEARLNRTTFYLHYEHIDELRDQLVNDILQELTTMVEGLTAVLDNDRTSQLIQLLNYLQLQREPIIVLAQFEQLEAHLFELMKGLIITRRSQSRSVSKQSKVDSDIKTASIVGIIMWWLKKGEHLSAETIANQINLMYRSTI